MSIHHLAADATIISSQGPIPVSAARPGFDRMLVLRENGTVGYASVQAVSQAESRPGYRFLGPLGDIVVSRKARILTRDGPKSADQIEQMIQSGRPARVEIIPPEDLPQWEKVPANDELTLRACLASLGANSIQVPASAEIGEDILGHIRLILRQAQVQFRELRDERWHVWIFEQVNTTEPRGSFTLKREALLALTAWGVSEANPLSRTRIGDAASRRMLVSAIFADRLGYDCDWIPGYHPVECRLRIIAGPVKPFISLGAVVSVKLPVQVVDLDGAGTPIVNLAMVDSRAS